MDEKIGIEEAGDSKTKYTILCKRNPFQLTLADDGVNEPYYILKKSYKKDGKWHNEPIHVFTGEIFALGCVAKVLLDECTKCLKP